MKKTLKILICSAITAAIILALVSCMTGGNTNNTGTGNGANNNAADETKTFTVTFNTLVSDMNIADKTINDGDKLYTPTLRYRDGYRLAGWRKTGETALCSFPMVVTENLSLTAVWEKEEDGHIYDSQTRISIVHNGTKNSKDLADFISDTLSNTLYVTADAISASNTEKYHEIVIGECERSVSKKAYAELLRLTGGEEKIAYLVYSDGKSLAFAYTGIEDELAFTMLKENIIESYLKESLNVKAGIQEKYSLSVDDYYLELDAKNLEEDWRLLEEYLKEDIGTAEAASFVAALKDLYSLYKPEMVLWYAKLYDPEIGGYYYSNSARDNQTVTYQGSTYPLLPDIESTNQALNFIISSQMSSDYAKDLPEYMREQIINFVITRQDPDSGYFYHPQWPKELTDKHTSRRSRDLGWAENILSKFSAKPLYTTPNGMQGSTVKAAGYLTLSLKDSDVSLVSKVVPTALTNANIENRETFEAYLKNFETSTTRNIMQHSYHVGNELTTQTSEIIARDKELAQAGADYSLMDILIEWLNKHQNAETGCWQKVETSDPYYAVNGLLKISGIYNTAKVPMPNAKAATQSAIAAISLDEPLGAVVDIYNPWFTIYNIVQNFRKYGTAEDKIYADEMVRELRLSAPAAIEMSKKKIAVFQKPDGSFSYGPNSSSNTSQGMPVAIANSYEGDVNATGISSTGLIGYMMQALELNSYKPALFGKTEFKKYLAIIDEKNNELEKKAPIDLSGYEKTDFEDGNTSESITSVLNSNEAALAVVDNSLVFTTSSGANDSLFITADGNVGNAVIFNADITLSSVSGSSTIFQLLFSDSENNTLYMPVIGYENGKITISDASSTGDASTRRVQEMKNDIALGESFNFGLEYYVLDDGSVRIKLFIDGKLIFVSDNYYNSHKNDTPASTSIEKMRFYSLNAASATMKIDNIIFTHGTVEYIDLALGAK